MKTIIVKTQQELDALPTKFEEYTNIHIQNDASLGCIAVSVARENSSVVARKNSSVVAWGNSSVMAWENSSVVARENSSVIAWGNSSVMAWGNSSVKAWENSSVEARENSSVKAWENSSVMAWGNSSVKAWGNSSVEAWENSSVMAWGNSSVKAWGNSSVEAWGNSGVHLFSTEANVILFMFAVCWKLIKTNKVKQKSKTTTIIEPTKTDGIDSWLEEQGIEISKKQVILFKRVSHDLKTMEDTPSETLWEIGQTLEHPAWNPSQEECGAGKFHACSRPYFCDEFRSQKNDRYLAIQIHIDDLYAWNGAVSYPHKIAFRKGTVLYECDRHGKEKTET